MSHDITDCCHGISRHSNGWNIHAAEETEWSQKYDTENPAVLAVLFVFIFSPFLNDIDEFH